MTRTLYRGLLWLHPAAFREEFGAEMQWIFDEVSPSGVIGLFADAVTSLLRQWIFRWGAWKIAAGFVGGILHMWLVFSCLMLRPPLPRIPLTPEEPCGNAVLDCLAIGQKQVTSCLNCETSPSSIPESPR
jgi:hypothetical protein